jgi:hypothetical protein
MAVTVTVVTALAPDALRAVKEKVPALAKVPVTRPVVGMMPTGALPPVLV